MLINEILPSLLISAHHVGYMIILLGISFIAITSPEIIWTSRRQVTALGVSGFCAVFLGVYLECTKLGEIVEIIGNFVLKS